MTTARDVEPVLPDRGPTPNEPGADETPDDMLGGHVSRRRFVQGAAIAGGVVAAGVTLAACGAGGSSSAAAATPGVLGKTSDIPVGGGKIYPNSHVVVTQPTAGTFKGFSSTCTHMGCTVDKVADGLIQCPCHGSRYSIVDGSVKAGPAPKPLPPEKLTVANNEITLD